ncbi:hypothetical protein [Endozoicomonas sp. SESOKO4]|uniref:hypothetical protein n=1 Tax=Endozoicomonas sp. SESOKO4 TaxID=2828745 RepID=UPI002148DA39|nr:hypothetical protein [Endozoicomonas sp. SESOKO4]
MIKFYSSIILYIPEKPTLQREIGMGSMTTQLTTLTIDRKSRVQKKMSVIFSKYSQELESILIG